MARTLPTIQTELDALTRTARRYQAGANEGGDGFNPHSATLRTSQVEYDQVAEATADARIAAIRAARDATWTKDVTIERRAAWNAWVKSRGKTIHPAQVADQITAQGWGMDDLKAAIQRHSL